ncbi:MAG: signal peptidase II [Deltaproteobacteria bacterium]|nr:signal peptidase II [Deltaproteobacteria bacterium]
MVSSSSQAQGAKDSGQVVRPLERYRLLGVVTAVSVVLDQLTKVWARADLRPIGLKRIIPGYFDLRFSLNEGAAWSFLADADSTFRRWFFLGTTLAAMALIATLYARARMDQKLLRWALALLFGGAIGNLIDRVREGHVVDFISLHLKDRFHWATFNVADIAITVGLLLLLFDLLKSRKKIPQGASPAAATTGERAPGRPRKRRGRR